MKTFYKISGVIFIIGCLFFWKFNYRKIEIYKSGTIINARVVFVPNCFTTKRHYNFKFEYKGKIHAKQIGVGSCKDMNEGDIIKLKTNDDSSIFLFENEYPYNDTIAIFLLFSFGIFLIYMGFKK
jgi:hypothetical protein